MLDEDFKKVVRTAASNRLADITSEINDLKNCRELVYDKEERKVEERIRNE